jgi:hypothetical protein
VIPSPAAANRSTPFIFKAGRSLAGGGGFGSSAANWLAHPPDNPFDCFLNPSSPFCPPKDTPSYLAAALVDASAYEGVAVWARRSPDSQGGIRINVGDQDTDDDISYLTYQADPTLPRNCERVRECACTNHKVCMDWAVDPLHNPLLGLWSSTTNASDSSSCSTAGGYCEDPNAGIVPGYNPTGSTATSCNTCNVNNCNQPYPAYPGGPPFTGAAGAANSQYDAQYYNKPCTPYTTRSGISTSYCFNPASDPPPAESDQQCGDHWVSGIYLTNQWTLYLVPFTSMQQQGFGKKSAKMDLKAVSVVRLTWDGGYIDFWIGKVAFYRHKS